MKPVDDRKILNYLCNVLQIKTEADLDPFCGARKSYEEMTQVSVDVDVTVPVEFNYDETRQESVVPARAILKQVGKFHSPHFSTMGDVSKCFLYGVVPRVYSSTVNGPVGVRPLWRHKALDARGKDFDQRIALAGGVSGLCFEMENTQGEKQIVRDDSKDILRPLPFGFTNTAFIASFGLATRQNVMFGCIKIPYNVCASVGLPVAQMNFGEPPKEFVEQHPENPQQRWKEVCEANLMRYYGVASMDKLKPDTYYVAIPFDHALAWALNSYSYALSRGLRSYKLVSDLGTGQDATLLYHLVTNNTFDRLLDAFGQLVQNNIDPIDLREYGFEFIPLLNRDTNARGVQRGQVHLRCTLSYLVPPMQIPPRLGIACSPKLPHASAWSATAEAQVEQQLDSLFVSTTEGMMPPKVVGE